MTDFSDLEHDSLSDAPQTRRGVPFTEPVEPEPSEGRLARIAAKERFRRTPDDTPKTREAMLAKRYGGEDKPTPEAIGGEPWIREDNPAIWQTIGSADDSD